MRKLFLILLLAMLPLQWSAAAVVSLCLPGATFGAQAASDANARTDAHATADAHAAAEAHAMSVHPTGHHGAHDRGHDSKAGHADHGGCCHATSSALPVQSIVMGLQAAPDGPVPHLAVPLASHPADSLFRPPRPALA